MRKEQGKEQGKVVSVRPILGERTRFDSGCSMVLAPFWGVLDSTPRQCPRRVTG